MPARYKTLPPPREKVEKNVAQRVAAGFVTDVIVIFRSGCAAAPEDSTDTGKLGIDMRALRLSSAPATTSRLFMTADSRI